MTYDIDYAWTKEFFQERIANSPNIKIGGVAAATWLYEFPESNLEEAERLNVILPLIKWCVEHNELTDELKDELYLYYEDYIGGKLNDILAEYEAEEVIKDLIECYKKVFG